MRGKDSVIRISRPGKNFLKSFHNRAMEMKMFDTIEGGQAIIIRNKDKAILYDGGAGHTDINSQLAERLRKYLKKNKAKLRAIIPSHNHKDHVNAIFPLLDKEPSKILRGDIEFYHQAFKRKGRFYKKMMKKIVDENIPDIPIRRWSEERINNWNGGQSIRLFCGPNISGDKGVYRSILMRVPFEKAIFLFTGDIDTKPTEKKLIKDDRTDHLLKNVDVFQITHHGSHNGTGDDFLMHTKPALFITSSDQEDTAHDLSTDTKIRIISYIESKEEKFDTEYYTIFNTYWNGDITIRTDGKPLTLQGVNGILFEVDLEFPL